LIDNVLANLFLRVVAVTTEKLPQLFISDESPYEVVDYLCDSVIASEAFIDDFSWAMTEDPALRVSVRTTTNSK
jgi:hypothetical protein